MTSEQKTAISMQRELVANMRDENQIMTTSKTVKACFHNHVIVSMESAECGILNLIKSILRDREAEFAKGIENGALRPIAVAASMFSDEIFSECQKRFSAGSIRYPLQTIRSYLSIATPQFNNGTIGKIELTSLEDPDRTCKKPRCKYYVIATPNK